MKNAILNRLDYLLHYLDSACKAIFRYPLILQPQIYDNDGKII